MLVWLAAASRDSALSGYRRAALARSGMVPAEDAEATATRFIAWLAETRQPWLVILDGVSDPAELDGLWPAGPAGHVVVTAADDLAVADSRNALVFPVGPFSPHEALTYLTARLSADPDQRLGAVDLVQELSCDPLALAQASATIASSGVNCRDYREIFATRREQIAEASGEQPAAKAVTWTLAMECADELAPAAARSCASRSRCSSAARGSLKRCFPPTPRPSSSRDAWRRRGRRGSRRRRPAQPAAHRPGRRSIPAAPWHQDGSCGCIPPCRRGSGRPCPTRCGTARRWRPRRRCCRPGRTRPSSPRWRARCAPA